MAISVTWLVRVLCILAQSWMYSILWCLQKQIDEEERVQRVALDFLTSKQKGGRKTMEEVIEENESAEHSGMYWMPCTFVYTV